MVQFIAVANNNNIYVNKGEIEIIFWKLQDKTLHTLAGAKSIKLYGYHRMMMV